MFFACSMNGAHGVVSESVSSSVNYSTTTKSNIKGRFKQRTWVFSWDASKSIFKYFMCWVQIGKSSLCKQFSCGSSASFTRTVNEKDILWLSSRVTGLFEQKSMKLSQNKSILKSNLLLVYVLSVFLKKMFLCAV